MVCCMCTGPASNHLHKEFDSVQVMCRPYVLPERYTYPLVDGDLGQIDKPKAMLFVTVVKVGHCQLRCMLRACMSFWDALVQQWPLSGA